MFKSLRVLVVVPARGGSKGIPLKNMSTVGDLSLIAIVGKFIQECDFIDDSIVSTDHLEIAKAARNAGLDVPFLRPAEISGDLVSDIDVQTHALLTMEEQGSKPYDIIVMLQPTSPFRKPRHYFDTLELLIEGKFDSVLTVTETDSKAHPLKQLVISDKTLGYYDPRGREIIARQQLEPLYQRNGFVYALRRECLLSQKAIIGRNSSAIITSDPFVNIDTFEDLAHARYLADG